MRFAQVHIAPEAKRIIESLRGDLREKVKNALREISMRDEVGTAVNVFHPSLTERPPASLRLYKAGRFRILFRRNNGTVWIDALSLDGMPGYAGGVKS